MLSIKVDNERHVTYFIIWIIQIIIHSSHIYIKQ